MPHGKTIYSTVIDLPPKEQREYARHVNYIHQHGFNTSVVQSSVIAECYGRAIVKLFRTVGRHHNYRIETMGVLAAIKAASYLVGRIVAKERTIQKEVYVTWPTSLPSRLTGASST